MIVDKMVALQLILGMFEEPLPSPSSANPQGRVEFSASVIETKTLE